MNLLKEWIDRTFTAKPSVTSCRFENDAVKDYIIITYVTPINLT